MQGFYDVPDFARAPWGAQRLMDFWSIQNNQDLERLGTQKLSSQRLVSYENKITDITIVLGGVDPVRTYPHWDLVLQSLSYLQKKSITLIGTGDVAELAGQTIFKLNLNLKIRNVVNQLSLSECIDELARTKLLLVADGGAMHLGVAVQVPQMVSLFIKEIPPNLRIPNRYHEHAIVSTTGFIKDIDASDIVQKIEHVLAGELN
jgi:ADP-heptose:LPS heptosyltransferase